ncbi:hypothetical protein [Proteiniclasticum ruminis]|uniref:hypothetical protein n=1 Tax=Proteiniclasticum ruminis TaxID=398199 RepID=UPI001160A2C4|nr:hypothetical protein [Proteiniclasticum ruminis]
MSKISQTGRTNGRGLIYPISEKAFRQFITLDLYFSETESEFMKIFAAFSSSFDSSASCHPGKEGSGSQKQKNQQDPGFHTAVSSSPEQDAVGYGGVFKR